MEDCFVSSISADHRGNALLNTLDRGFKEVVLKMLNDAGYMRGISIQDLSLENRKKLLGFAIESGDEKCSQAMLTDANFMRGFSWIEKAKLYVKDFLGCIHRRLHEKY